MRPPKKRAKRVIRDTGKQRIINPEQHRVSLKKYFTAHVPMRTPAEFSCASFALWSVCHAIQEDPRRTANEQAFCELIIPLLEEAALEPFANLPRRLTPKEFHQATVMASDAALYGMLGDEAGRRPGTLFLGVWYFVADQIARGMLELYEGSTFAQAIELITEEMRKNWSVVGEMEKAGQKLARRMRERLEDIGLFRPVVRYVEVDEAA